MRFLDKAISFWTSLRNVLSTDPTNIQLRPLDGLFLLSKTLEYGPFFPLALLLASCRKVGGKLTINYRTCRRVSAAWDVAIYT